MRASILLLLAGCGDNGLVVHNTEPEVTISSPGEGAQLLEGEATILIASVHDDQDDLSMLELIWALDGDPIVSEAISDGTNLSQVVVTEGFEAGEHTLSITAIDTSAAAGSDEVRFAVVSNAAPSVSFVAPVDGSSALAGPIGVDLLVEDAEDLASDVALSWSGSATSGQTLPTHADSDGHARVFLELEAGVWTLTVTATDSLGATASALVSFSTVEGDGDDDGHDAVEHGGDDCDDGDATISPSSDEGCNGVDDDCDGEIDEGFDADGDTVPDCEDVEMCDGLDNDGDGETDEADAIDPATWYTDADADGHGTASTIDACDMPAGYAAIDDDCDDAAADVFPGGTETCDGVDQNCDGAIDEGVLTTFYADADADGFGGVVTTEACSAPIGYIATAGDCDDAASTVSPAGVETCDDVDQDCDGTVDEGFDADGDGTTDCHDTELCDGLDNDGDGVVDEDDALDVTTWYADADADGYGEATLSVIACDAPSGYVSLATDCDDGEPAIHPDAAETDCADPTDYNCDGSSGYADADGDGYAACEECEDTDSAVHPGAAEACDGLDNNCDGSTDGADATDALDWYADLDGDGYGDTTTVVSCTSPADYVALDGDCDDGDASAYPGATEYCDGSDDDCDGSTDEADSADARTWYRDVDSDGYGVTTTTSVSCSAPVGYAVSAGDCNDAVATISPAATEACDASNTDEDCDGAADDLDSAATGTSTWYADADADAFGNASITLAACDAPSGYVGDATDCDDSDSGDFPGATEVCNSDDEDCDGTVDDGATTTYYADADADGYGGTTSAAACSVPSGYVATSTDCDDADSATHPGASEYCDGEDDNCDGTVDESTAVDADTWYRDADGDTYGVSTTTRTACSAPAGYVATLGDCDDTLSSISPAATEVCDAANTDEDCDTLADDLDSVASGTTTWYRDADTDTYGSSATTRAACDLPSGYVTNATDCDDTDSGDHPGATETCNSDDEDCDGTADDGVTTTYYADGDADGYGGTTTAAACSAPAGYVATYTDCNDAASAVHPAATEYCNGYDDNCDGSTDEATAADADTWYRDADGDTYGSATSTRAACTAPAGYVATLGDCDDALSTISPAASERCDASNTDEDCDGLADDLDTAATGTTTWYADADVDGYGDPVNTDVTCDLPSGFVSNDDDCDDNAADVSPDGLEVCNSEDDDCDGTVDESASDAITWYADADSDTFGSTTSTMDACVQPSGYLATGTDCDDSRAAVNTAAAELCATAYDDDCDGSVNENSATDVSTWYRDVDADGYGIATSTSLACTVPSGYTAVSGDCNDASASISPGDPEICDSGSTDEDCDGLADDLDSSATGTTTWYADTDNDAYGTSSSTLSRCDAPSGYVNTSTDCDDTIGAVNPAASEACATAYDDDCDGSANEDNATGCATSAADNDGDGYGSSSSTACTCGGSGGTTDDCDDGDADIHPTATEVCGDGVDDDCSGSDLYCSLAGEYILGTDSDATLSGGGSVASGDFDGDGDADLVTATHYTGSSASAAYTYIYTSPVASAAPSPSTTISGPTTYWNRSVAAGDTNDDGYADLAISMWNTTGYVYLYMGPLTAGSQTYIANDDAIFTGSSSEYLGSSIDMLDDVNGDGIGDIAIGAMYADNGGNSSGNAGVFFGPLDAYSGAVSSSVADIVWYGASEAEYMGASVKGAGDVDGDGLNDLVVGSAAYWDTGHYEYGAAWVMTDLTAPGSHAGSDADWFIWGDAEYDRAGASVAGGGDLNSDGYADILVSAPGDDDSGSAAGTVAVFYGPQTGTSGRYSDCDVKFRGEAASDQLGGGATNYQFSVAGEGDVDGDGLDDILMGAPGNDDQASGAGASYLFYGPIASSLSVVRADGRFYGPVASGAVSTVELVDDANEDGYTDILTGKYFLWGGGG